MYNLICGNKCKAKTKGSVILNTSTMLDGSSVFDAGFAKIACTSQPHETEYFYHSQVFWEFIYVKRGFALCGGLGSSALLCTGDFTVIAPGEEHSLIASADTELCCCLFCESELGNMKEAIFALPGFIELSLRAKAQSKLAKTSSYENIRLDFAERQEYIRLCERINIERINKNRGWQTLLKSYLSEILVFYSRLDITAKRVEKETDTVKSTIETIIRYLETNYSSNVTGADLAKISGVTAEHILKQFKNELSISPSEYLRRYRIAKSMEMLHSSDLAVTEIAKMCGFVDMSAYSRLFKQYEGETPSNYRKKFQIFE